jgi:LPS-assembly protein
MKFKNRCSFISGVLAFATLFSITAYSAPSSYQETSRGDYFYLNPFSHKPETPQAHWEYASALEDRGKLKRALKQFEILVQRWPESPRAAAAKQKSADLHFELGNNKEAFEAYEELIQEYYTGIKDYDAVLERMKTIAEEEMTRKRMKWLFGGYRAPERAVPLFESILRNAPQWDEAAQMQFDIGEAYRKNDDLEMAINAYSIVEYRYPDSPVAEKAAFAKIKTLRDLVEATSYSVDIREQAQLATDIFPEIYPESEYRTEVAAFSEELREMAAQHTYEVAEFYERVPRPPKTESAVIYYRKTVDEYGGTTVAEKSADRLRVLVPAGTAAQPADGQPGAEGAVAQPTPSGSAPEAPGTLPERLTTDDEAVEVTADRMEYQGDWMIAEGNVSIQQEGASLQADHVSVNPETGEIVATGNILMLREGSRWEGQHLVYNYKTREGTFGDSTMFFDPAYITAGSSERISTNEFLMRDVMMTTCEGDNPLIYAKAKEVRLTDNGEPGDPFIKAKNVTFYVGPVPVFYTPVWQRHLGYRVFTTTVGVGGRLGAFALVSANLYPTDWLKTTTHFDLYSKRGIGLGQDFKWQSPNGSGYIKTYYINDQDPDNDDDLTALEQRLINPDRYRIKFGHREQIDEETYFVTRLNWLSDPVVIEDFFSDEFQHEANPENFAVLQRSSETYAVGLRVDRRLNDFYTTVERIPELTADRYRARIGKTPFYFESENNIGFFERLGAEATLPVEPQDYRSARFDTYHQIFLPLRYDDFLNVIPRAAYRGTWYSETATGAGDANWRNVFEAGLQTSFKAYKPITEQNGFFGQGLRHVAEPYVDYTWRAKPNLRPDDLHQFDGSADAIYGRERWDKHEDIDEIDKRNEVRFGIRNFLQTQRGANRIANILDADIYTSYRFEPLPGQTEMGPLGADAELHLTDQFSLFGDLEYDWHSHDLTPANARMRWVTDDLSEYTFGYRYRQPLDVRDPVGRRSLLTASALLWPNSKWSYEFGARYDTRRSEWEDRRFMVNHRFDCVGMGLGLKIDEDDEAQLWFQLWLTAFRQPVTDIGR